MQQLQLHHTPELQGKFTVRPLNFLFTFQVNCPGCFLYGIPFVNRLYHEFGSQLSFLGLSTAFEDFEYNTLANTKLLVQTGQVIGETKKALADRGLEGYTEAIDFPVAMDVLADETFDYAIAAIQICKINPNYQTWPAFEQKALEDKVLEYLKMQTQISLTFTLNQMRGTPTMLVFNDRYEILFHQFGHTAYETLQSRLKDLIATFA